MVIQGHRKSHWLFWTGCYRGHSSAVTWVIRITIHWSGPVENGNPTFLTFACCLQCSKSPVDPCSFSSVKRILRFSFWTNATENWYVIFIKYNEHFVWSCNWASLVVFLLSALSSFEKSFMNLRGLSLWHKQTPERNWINRQCTNFLIIMIMIIIKPRQCLWCCHHAWSIARVHHGSRDECSTAPGGRQPLDQADRLEP